MNELLSAEQVREKYWATEIELDELIRSIHFMGSIGHTATTHSIVNKFISDETKSKLLEKGYYVKIDRWKDGTAYLTIDWSGKYSGEFKEFNFTT